MRGHIPFLAALVPGLVTAVSGTTRHTYLVSGGFLEASGPADHYHVIVLADDAEEAGDIDAAEAKRRIEQAKKEAEEDREDRTREAELAASLAGPQLGRD
jgi:F0F1-type ATP synthase epsilon subunit